MDGGLLRYYDPKVGARRISIGFDWAAIGLNEGYDKKIIAKEREYMAKALFPKYLEFIKKTIDDLREDQSARKWLPDARNYCGFCAEKEGKGTNHEAFEFITSLLDISTAEFMDSDEFLGLLKENNLIKDE